MEGTNEKITASKLNQEIEGIFKKVAKGEYSKISKILIHNFMSIPSAEIEFTEEGIISFVGKNSRGKTAIRKVLNILFFDDMQNDQYKLIRWGSEYFGIGLEFDDGVSINKYKYIGGSSEWEMEYKGLKVYSNSINGTLTSVPKQPDVISKYLGVVKDNVTGELLNIRTNMDKMFLVTTNGSENYKMLGTILKTETTFKSVDKLNKESTKLTNALNVATQRIVDLDKEITQMKVITNDMDASVREGIEKLTQGVSKTVLLKTLDKLKESATQVIPNEMQQISNNKLKDIGSLLQQKQMVEQPIPKELVTLDNLKYKELKTLLENMQQIQNEKTPKHIGRVDNEKLKQLQGLSTTLNQIDKNSVPKSVTSISNNRLKELKNLTDTIQILKTQRIPTSIQPVTKENKIETLHNMRTQGESLKQEEQLLKEKEGNLKELQTEIEEISKKYNISVCKNCGTLELKEHAH